MKGDGDVISIGARLGYVKVRTLKYLGSVLTNQNSFHKAIKYRFKAGNSCYYSLKNTLVFSNSKIEIHKTIILSDVLYGQLDRN